MIRFVFAITFLSFSLAAQELSYRGSLGAEGRVYEDDDNSETNDHQLSVKGVFSAEYEKDHFVAKAGILFREAFYDKTRDFFALTDTSLGLSKDDWSVSAGTHIYNWRVLEMFTAVDTINAFNYDNTDETERLGLPSVMLTKEFDSSFFQAIYIPNTTPSLFTQQRNRQGLKIPLQSPEFVTGDFKTDSGSSLFQYLLRYKHSFDNLEVDLSYARKFDTFYPIIAIDIPSVLTPGLELEDLDFRPYYFPVRQSTLALQGNYGEWIWKLETANVDFDNFDVATYFPPTTVTTLTQIDHTRVAGGLEKTFYYQSNHSGTMYLEFTHVFTNDEDELQLLGAFIRDAGLGYRHSFNDFKGNELLFYYIKDTLTGNESVYSARHEFRPFAAWKLSTTVTVIDAPRPSLSDPLSFFYGLQPIYDSDNILITLTRFF